MNRSDWLTDELIEAAFERRAGRAAPGDLRETILTLSAASSQRSPWRAQSRSTMSTPVLRPALLKGIAAATVIGVIAVGAAFFVYETRPARGRRTQPDAQRDVQPERARQSIGRPERGRRCTEGGRVDRHRER